jgi:long-chain acyl-CoA synthetase
MLAIIASGNRTEALGTSVADARHPRNERSARSPRSRPRNRARRCGREARAGRGHGTHAPAGSVAANRRRDRRPRALARERTTRWPTTPGSRRTRTPSAGTLRSRPVPYKNPRRRPHVRDRPAVEFMGKRATYRPAEVAGESRGGRFQKLGVGPGVHVGLYLPNTPHYLIAFFGVLKAGGTVVNYSPLDAEKVLEHKVEDSETSMIVTLDLPTLLPQMEALLGKTDLKKLIVGGMADLPGFPECPRLENGRRDEKATCRSAICSTTTALRAAPDRRSGRGDRGAAVHRRHDGLPKGAMLTHANLTAASQQYHETTKHRPADADRRRRAHAAGVAAVPHLRAQRVMLLTHRLGGDDLARALRPGSRPQRPREQESDVLLRRAHDVHGPARASRRRLARSALDQVRAPRAARRSRSKSRSPSRRSPGKINEGWGMTETSPSGTFTPMTGKRKKRLVRHPRSASRAQVRRRRAIRRSTSPLGETRRDLHQRPQRHEGLLEQPRGDRRRHDGRRLHAHRRRRYMDEDGFVFIVDRIKDMLLCGGYNVYPRNIEEAIYTHPSVAEVCVIGVPDAYPRREPEGVHHAQARRGASSHSTSSRRSSSDKLGKHEMVQHHRVPRARCPRRRSARSRKPSSSRKRPRSARKQPT